LVYSTCSISPLENDGVIERLHKSRPEQFQVLPTDDPRGEPTIYGRIVLPDREACGPIFFVALLKT
jgi:16S rRNA C967 or C1407 C5-methylase (RsmB/RsmF family)